MLADVRGANEDTLLELADHLPSEAAEALLDRMLHNIDRLCAERDQLKKEQPGPNKGKVLSRTSSV